MEFLKNQITHKSGFLIYTDYWEKYFSKMTGEQVKEVFKIVFHFNLTFEILETDDLAVEMVIATIIDNIKRDAVKRTKRAIASANNGKLGGRPAKDKKTNNNPAKPSGFLEKYQPLVNGLKLILEEKLKKQISTKGWEKDIQLLIERDLKERQDAIDDVKKAIQTISDNFNEQYFPVIQSANSLRAKFSKIEAFLDRKLSPHLKQEKNAIKKSIHNNFQEQDYSKGTEGFEVC